MQISIVLKTAVFGTVTIGNLSIFNKLTRLSEDNIMLYGSRCSTKLFLKWKPRILFNLAKTKLHKNHVSPRNLYMLIWPFTNLPLIVSSDSIFQKLFSNLALHKDRFVLRKICWKEYWVSITWYPPRWRHVYVIGQEDNIQW